MLMQKILKDSNVPLKEIDKIKFEIMSPDLMKYSSVCELSHSELFDKGNNKIPKSGGLLDIHLGVIDKGMKCMTCNSDHTVCPGLRFIINSLNRSFWTL